MLRTAFLRRPICFDSRIIPQQLLSHRSICTPTSPTPSPPVPPPADLEEAERMGRDLAKLAKLADVLRGAIQDRAREVKPPAEELLVIEQDVDETVELIGRTLDNVGRPCTVEELADRINRNIVPIPVGALGYRDFLRMQALRDSIEETLVSLQVLPPEDTWLEGSGKDLDRFERKRLRKEAEARKAAGGVNGNEEDAGMENGVVEEEIVLKELRPVSSQELERRKAHMENATTMEEVLRGYDTALLEVGRTNKVVKEGTTMSMRALVVIGNRKGTAGYGEGKSDTAQHAIERACRDAKRNLLHIELHQGRTIYHRVQGRFVVSKISLWPAPQGTGISANNNFSTIFELFGLKDIGAKLHGPRTLGNAVKALFNALSNIRTPESVAEARGLQEIVRPKWRELPKGVKRRKLRPL